MRAGCPAILLKIVMMLSPQHITFLVVVLAVPIFQYWKKV